MSDLRLPDKLSELIRVAVKDIQQCMIDPAYKINMGTWHSPITGSGVCMVCLGGSVLAQTLKVPPSSYTAPFHWDADTQRKLEFLDGIRGGSFWPPINLVVGVDIISLRLRLKREFDRLMLSDMSVNIDYYLWAADQLKAEGL
jgi:hypothetical protein